jgi:hypothetical protein
VFSTSFVEFCSFKWVATIFCAVIYYLLYFWYSVALVVPLNNSIYHPTVYILLSFFTIVVFGQPYPYMDKPVNNVIWVLLLIFVLHFRMLFTMGCFFMETTCSVYFVYKMYLGSSTLSHLIFEYYCWLPHLVGWLLNWIIPVILTHLLLLSSCWVLSVYGCTVSLLSCSFSTVYTNYIIWW